MKLLNNEFYKMAFFVRDNRALSIHGEIKKEYYPCYKLAFHKPEDMKFISSIIVKPTKSPYIVEEMLTGIKVPFIGIRYIKDDDIIYNEILGDTTQLAFAFSIMKPDFLRNMLDEEYILKVASDKEIEHYRFINRLKKSNDLEKTQIIPMQTCLDEYLEEYRHKRIVYREEYKKELLIRQEYLSYLKYQLRDKVSRSLTKS